MEQHTQASMTEEEIKAQELLGEKEPDSKLRTYSGPLGQIITVLFLVWAIFQV
jgi:hypothetical protein